MYTISQFAKLCNTSTKTIRFYDNKGILPADYVSEENGYRFYEKDTVEIFRQKYRRSCELSHGIV